MPPSTDADLKQFIDSYDQASRTTKARIAALTAILHSCMKPDLDWDQRTDVIKAAIRFCEITATLSIFEKVCKVTEEIATGTPQDRANQYAYAMMKAHEEMVDWYPKISDRFFNLFEMIDPRLARQDRQSS